MEFFFIYFFINNLLKRADYNFFMIDNFSHKLVLK